MKEETLRTTAIRAAASFDERKLTQTLLSSFDSLDAGDQLETLLSLSSRSGSGLALTGAIRDGKIARGDVPAYVARSLQRVVGNGFIEVWGPIESLGADKEAVFTKYRNLLKPSQIAAANADHGKAVFQKTCQACHQLHGEGGKVGPDITGANRSNLEYLLTNILTPSAEIQDAYRMQMILTDEGRVYSGIPAEENERQLKLRVANQTEPIAIAKATIESREVAKVSMMPTGILDQMTDDEVRDLFAYLQSGAQAVRAQP
jgi:putative heme-binding domain-containing protein